MFSTKPQKIKLLAGGSRATKLRAPRCPPTGGGAWRFGPVVFSGPRSSSSSLWTRTRRWSVSWSSPCSAGQARRAAEWGGAERASWEEVLNLGAFASCPVVPFFPVFGEGFPVKLNQPKKGALVSHIRTLAFCQLMGFRIKPLEVKAFSRGAESSRVKYSKRTFTQAKVKGQSQQVRVSGTDEYLHL